MISILASPLSLVFHRTGTASLMFIRSWVDDCQDSLERFFGCQRQRGGIQMQQNSWKILKLLGLSILFHTALIEGIAVVEMLRLLRLPVNHYPSGDAGSSRMQWLITKIKVLLILVRSLLYPHLTGSCNNSILMKALLYVVNEEAHRNSYFQEQSPKQIAQGLAEWIREHPDSASAFIKAVVESFLNCIPFSNSSPYKKNTWTQLWGKYHTLRTRIAYVEDWKLFLCTSQVSYNPIFYQCVGHFIFKDLVKAQPAVHSTDSTLRNVPDFTYEEMNALLYTAGYVPRALKKKLLRSSLHNKKDLELCLDDLISDGEETLNYTSDWLASINRGGLIRVSDMAFQLRRGDGSYQLWLNT